MQGNPYCCMRMLNCIMELKEGVFGVQILGKEHVGHLLVESLAHTMLCMHLHTPIDLA